MAKMLEDMLTTLEGHGAMYNATGDLSLASLREKSILLNSTNKDVATKYGLLKIIRAERELVYQLFSDVSQRIKFAVKGQYGTNSQLYKTIKGIKV